MNYRRLSIHIFGISIVFLSCEKLVNNSYSCSAEEDPKPNWMSNVAWCDHYHNKRIFELNLSSVADFHFYFHYFLIVCQIYISANKQQVRTCAENSLSVLSPTIYRPQIAKIRKYKSQDMLQSLLLQTACSMPHRFPQFAARGTLSLESWAIKSQVLQVLDSWVQVSVSVTAFDFDSIADSVWQRLWLVSIKLLCWTLLQLCLPLAQYQAAEKVSLAARGAPFQ